MIEQAVKAKFADAIQGTQTSRVGAVIGNESAKTSLIALAVALVGIFV